LQPTPVLLLHRITLQAAQELACRNITASSTSSNSSGNRRGTAVVHVETLAHLLVIWAGQWLVLKEAWVPAPCFFVGVHIRAKRPAGTQARNNIAATELSKGPLDRGGEVLTLLRFMRSIALLTAAACVTDFTCRTALQDMLLPAACRIAACRTAAA
jgi:hypothetical protein